MNLSHADLTLFVRVETNGGLAGYVEAALEGYATASLRDLLASLEDHAADVDQETLDSIRQGAQEEHRVHHELARGAVFLSIWASFELAVTEYVESHLGGPREPRLRVKDLRGGVLEATKTLVTKLFHREFDAQQARWSEVVALRHLRNHLAHANAFADPADRRLRKRIQSIPGLSVDAADLITFAPTFWPHLRACQVAFAEELVRAVNPRSRSP